MTFPFVRAKYYTPRAITEVRGFLWHMAEGYGTVSWLTHPSSNNSAHFVIERSGRIVQMVQLGDASHSAHVNIDADDRDAADCGIYSDDIGRSVLGTGWSNINRYVISVEVEGYRAVGPNADQVAAIVRLYRYLRTTFPSARGNLGHRDVQDYKSCPGCLFPWALIDGHGRFSSPKPEAPVVNFTMLYDKGRPIVGRLRIKPEDADTARWLRLSDNTRHEVSPTWDKQAVKVRLHAPIIAGKPETDDWMLGWLIGDAAAFVLDRNAIVDVYGWYNDGLAAATSALAGVQRE